MVIGLAIIAAAECLLFMDVLFRGGVVVPGGLPPAPNGALQSMARFVAVYMTPIAWTGFLLAAEGMLTRLDGRSPVRERPYRFILAYLTSIPVWLFFDWINFTIMGAWDYHGLASDVPSRTLGYFLAFGAISPAMFLAAELFLRTPIGRITGRPARFGRRAMVVSAVLGVLCLLFPFLIRGPAGSLTLWLGVALLLDPVNAAHGAPSIIGDWRSGRYGRTVALMAGGLVCGLLWEFWNFWAAAKWTYDLPFLGPLEAVRYFEMPVLGLAGFPPFAIECWVAFQTIVLLARRLGAARIETLPAKSIL